MTIFISDKTCPRNCPLTGQVVTEKLATDLPACTAGSVTSDAGAYKACIGTYSGNGDTVQIQDDAYLGDFLNDGVFCDIKGWSMDAKFNVEGEIEGRNTLGFQIVTNGSTGTWSISNPTAADIVISLKASNKWSAYYIEGGSTTTGGDWFTGFSLNKKGIPHELGHATIWISTEN